MTMLKAKPFQPSTRFVHSGNEASTLRDAKPLTLASHVRSGNEAAMRHHAKPVTLAFSY